MGIEALSRAIEIVGTQAELARRISVKPAYVWNWLYRDKDVPADAVRAVSEATGWQVTPHDLRRDLYPNPTDALPQVIQPQQTAA